MTRLCCLIAAVVLALGTGCGGSGPASDAQVLRVGNGVEPADLDAHIVTGAAEAQLLLALSEGLTSLNLEAMEPIPGVAESWAVSGDGRVYTFTLRENAKWSDGTPLTAQDFVYSWQRMLTPALGGQYAYMLHCLKNGRAFNEGEITDFTQVGARAEDERTLVVTLEAPTPYFLSMQVHYSWFPVPQHVIEKFGGMAERGTAWTQEGNFVSNGPYRLLQWRPKEVLRVTRNEHYWDAGNVKLDEIAFYPISNEQTEERSFRAGELDITYRVPLTKIPQYREDAPQNLHLDPSIDTMFFRFNVTKPPFDDVRVRRAFTLALDRPAMVNDVLRGGEAPATHYVPPGIANYASETKFTPSVDEARALLAEAGYPGGQGFPPVEILYNTSEENRIVCEAIQQMWRSALQVDVRLLNEDWKVYLDSLTSLRYDIARSRWLGDVNDAVNFLEMYLTGGGNNRTGWSNAEYDGLIRRAYAEADPEVRRGILQEAEALLLRELPICPVVFQTNRYLVSDRVRGIVPNVLNVRRWQDLSLAPAA